LLRYVSENRSNPRVVNSKMAIEKLTARVKNITWTNPQIKRHKKSHELRLIRPQARRTQVFKFLTPQMPSLEKIVNIHGFK